MQEQFDITLPPQFVYPKDSAELQLAMQTLFEPGTHPYHLLLEALTEENKDKFGSSKFEGLKFEVRNFDAAVLKGRLRINYGLQLTFSCSGIVNNLNNQHSYWNFEIDKASITAHFTGDEYGELRSTADEF